MDPLASIKQTFFQECDEQLSDLESGLMQIEDGNHDPETVNAVFRSVHSIKGGAAAFGYEELVEFVHVFESTLDMLRSNTLEATPAVTKVLLRASDVLSDLVRAARNDAKCDNESVDSVRNELEALCKGVDSAEVPGAGDDAADDDISFVPVTIDLDSIFDENAFAEESAPPGNRYKISFRPKPSFYSRAHEPLRILREASQLGECKVQCNFDDVPFLTELDPEGAYFFWTIDLETTVDVAQIREVFEFVESDCDLSIDQMEEESPGVEPEAHIEAIVEESVAPPAPAAPPEPLISQSIPAPPASNDAEAGPKRPAENKAAATEGNAPAQQPTIRVDLDKVDRLINLVGELVINQAVLSQRVSEAELPRASSVVIGLEELEQLTRDIQDSVMAIRAQPVKPIFQRMSRTVREVAAITKKAVRLVVDGEGTEVDKTVIERLTDPLTHMVRNAVDHGIESPEARLAAGKPEEGTLRLSAMHRSGRIVIEVADDGAGINRKRVREIAVDKGLIPDNAVLSDEEVDNLIFLPGFSTNATASAISGRGVGMDVVKRAIQALGGRISILSRQGYGSTFSMSLPLTLAVLDGMVVTVGDQTLILPLTAVVETLQPKPENVHALGTGVRVIGNRNSFIPLIDIGAALRYRFDEVDPTAQVALLVESENGEKCALLVDAIQGQRQVVIKSLESNYGHVPGIAAATILGDGRVALIVDVDAVINLLRGDGVHGEAQVRAAE